jgi:type II secretory pathway pseudopilin PulG
VPCQSGADRGGQLQQLQPTATGGVLRRGRSRRRSAPGQTVQGGYSLIEVLVSVVLVGSIVLALAAGMLTLVRSTRSTSEQQRVETALSGLTESLKSTSYLSCEDGEPTPEQYRQAHDRQPDAWQPRPGLQSKGREFRDWRITRVEHWHPGDAGQYGSYRAGCPSRDFGRQRLTVTLVPTPDGGQRPAATVVLSQRLSGAPS